MHVLIGEAKNALSDALVQAHTANSEPPYAVMPNPTPMDCASRQDDFGRRYYAALGIDRADMAARSRQTARNFVFFDAPVGIIFTIDASLTKHSWLDYGLYLQNLMIAAQARGLATCPQVSFVRYQSVISKQLGLATNEAVVCGMSLGYPDEEAELNHLEMPRESLENFTKWYGTVE
jgi:nitroreductase